MKRVVPLGLLLAVLAGASIISSPKATNGQSAGLVSSVLNRMVTMKSITGLLCTPSRSAIGTSATAKQASYAIFCCAAAF